MPVYRVTIKGRRKSILTKAESAAKARDAVVECELVTAEKMVDALGAGEKIWTPGEDLPADEPEPEADTKETVVKPDATKPDSDPEKDAAGTKA